MGQFSPQLIEEILQKTLGALEASRSQMWEIAETARNEYNRIKLSIDELKGEIRQLISEVDRLEARFRQVRRRLYEVSANYQDYSEEEKRQVYQEADQIRGQMTVAREREKNLRMLRDEQEQALVNVGKMVEKAEGLLSQVGIALDFLSGNIDSVNQQLLDLQTRHQIGQRIIKSQEEERKRLAREIHDGPAQDLANVVFKTEICEKTYIAGDHDQAFEELKELKALVKTSLKEVRRIIYSLRPMALDDLGLVPTVKRLLEDVREQSGIKTNMVVFGDDKRLESAVEVTLFRTIQEAVNNSRKHAKARQIRVRIEYLQHKVKAVIEDDGIGFDINKVKEDTASGQGHFGIFGMRERVELLEGDWNIQTAPGKGTRISVAISLKREGL